MTLGDIDEAETMWICEGSKIDWTAVAAIIALVIWLADGWRRRKERAATRKLLAQILTIPLMEAQVEIAQFRASLVPSSVPGDTSVALLLANNGEVRDEFYREALRVKIDLPTQFIDKADLFDQVTSDKLSQALAQIAYFHRLWLALKESSNDHEDLLKLLEKALSQVIDTDESINQVLKSAIENGKTPR